MSPRRRQEALAQGTGRNTASFRLAAGHVRLEAQVSVSAPGLLAIVRASTRKRPDARPQKAALRT